ncbi:aldo/keto reductase [Nocardioides sp.]|uniref:aldo/keto reductase n=1 Tax=Nocardioides sp. TaxID=35761 RepID=UPI0031FE538E|nr:aldo/keto reductase [Nocardioides sp.]
MTSSPPATLPAIALTGTDKPLTTFVLGTMSFGDTVADDVAARLVTHALEHGITAIDTANVYAQGRTEEILAPLIAARRDDILLATKAGMPHPDAGEHALLSRAGLRAAIHGSLSRLRTDHIDLFYLHQPDPQTPVEETLEAVTELRREGKIGALGVSNFAAWQIGDVAHAAQRVGTPGPVVAQNVYNLLARRLEDEYVAFARAHRVRTMCYNPLAGGLLATVQQFEQEPTSPRYAGSRLAEMYRNRYWSRELLEAVAELAGVADEAGLTLPELGLRWVLSQDGADAVLLGAGRLEHLVSNLRSVLEGPLDPDVLAACEEISRPLRGPMPAYNR